MNEIILISLIFCFAYGIESVFGLGGTIISLALLSLFFDIKDMIILALFASILASALIICTDRHSLDQ